MLRSSWAAAFSASSAVAAARASRRSRQRLGHGGAVALGAPGFQALDLLGLDPFGNRQNRFGAGGERRGLGLDELIDSDHHLLAALDCFEPSRIGFDQLLFHVTGLDRGDCAAHGVDPRALG